MSSNQNPFPHRRNRDGTYDSICVHCFATVGTGKTEDELLEAEKLHVCDEELLFYASRSNQPQVARISDETLFNSRHPLTSR